MLSKQIVSEGLLSGAGESTKDHVFDPSSEQLHPALPCGLQGALRFQPAPIPPTGNVPLGSWRALLACGD